MGHGLDGEELEEAYQRAQTESKPKRRDREEQSSQEHKGGGRKLAELPPIPKQGSAEKEAPAEEEATSKPTGADGGMEEESGMQRPNGKDEDGIPLPDLPTSVGGDEAASQKSDEKREGADLGQALDRLRRAKERLRIAKEETGEEVRRETPTGGVISSLLGRTKTEMVVERTEAEEELCEQYRKEVAEAEKKLQRALGKR